MSISVQDQTGNLVFISRPAVRIVSLVPSITELLFDLGLREEVTGITKFCVHPHEWYKTKERVGGTKNISLKKISALAPDLIFANKEENVKEQVEALAQIAPVYLSNIATVDDALQMIKDVARLTGKDRTGAAMVEQIQNDLSQIQINDTYNVLYLIWQKPYMSVGGDTFINSMLNAAGFRNVLEHQIRYPAVTTEDIRHLRPQFIFLSSEPYPFREKHMVTLKKETGVEQILLVDGEIFSWYGSKMLRAAAYFRYLKQHLGI